MKNLIISLNLVGLFFTSDLFAYKNRCVTRFEGAVQGICLGRVLPASKTRNFHRNSQRLECSGNVDHFVRIPQRYDFDKWATAISNDRRDDAYQLRRSTQPDIKWKGRIPYQTLEMWSYEDCEVVTSALHCGTRTETERYDCSYTESGSCSGSGKNQRCTSGRRISKTCTRTIEVPETCWADIVKTETWPCSSEVMTYEAQYVRPSESEWNPKTADYKDAIPNKYDLLPGELEDVQSYNTASRSTILSPTIKVGDAWNDYSMRVNINGGNQVSCVQNSNYHVKFDIYTVKRNNGKKTPNAFRLPLDVDGKKIMPIDTKVVDLQPSKDGLATNGPFTNVSVNADGSFLTAKPLNLLLDDTASAMMSLIAEQSQKNIVREEAKAERGQGTNPDGVKIAEFAKKDPAFFKNTRIRVQLVHDNRYWWNTKHTRDMFSQDVESTGGVDFRVVSKNQDIKFADLWKIDLDREVNGKKFGIYQGQWWNGEQELKPGKKYILKVSMYQRGAKGFYLQDCDEDQKAWQCKWYSYPIFMHRSADDVFSDPLEIRFRTPENMTDSRNFGQKLADFFELF